ncbi:MAG: dephospho-CoA kinase [Waltera sp.]
MRFIGITGGVGAGKTEILKYIGQHYKCEIYLADEIGHKVKEPGTEGYHAGSADGRRNPCAGRTDR